MEIRPIDANALHAEISKWPENVMYKDWVQSAIATSPTIPAPQWISVKDRLPEDASDVLVVAFWHKKYQVLTGWHSLGGWLVTAGNEERPLDVTHWMPLPEPPEEVRDDGAHIEP